MYQPKLEKEIRCPLEYGLSVFGGKWASRVLCVLAAREPVRYTALRRELCNITDPVLADTLRSLQQHGMIGRQQFDSIPPRVEYSLTDKGRSALPILQQICRWSGQFYREDPEGRPEHCRKCDHR